ncbi:MAG: hypothetical protein AB8B91_06395 [Rubripirellula sp.]
MPNPHSNSETNFHAADAPQRHKLARQRQIITLVFAIVLIWVSSVVSAQPPVTIQADCIYFSDASATEADLVRAASMSAQVMQFDGESDASAAIPSIRLSTEARPKYVQLAAGLSNFDSDADPDGWRADLVLRDQQDRPVVVRANASFELMPRVARVSSHRYENVSLSPPVRWTERLEFGPDGVARVKLPLRKSLYPSLGWSPSFPSRSNRGPYSKIYTPRDRNRRLPQSDLRDLVATPEYGQLRVRVSVPGEGTFESKVPVRLRPSGLVDTEWPYR